jgi:predicted O-methyltransferase YrrM
MLIKMRSELKNDINDYFEKIYGPEIPSIQLARDRATKLNKLGISLGPLECQILGFLISSYRPTKFIELGTLTGATAITILNNMPLNSTLWSFEKNEAHAKYAREAWALDPMKNSKNFVIEVGDAREQLKSIEGHGPFDGIFIDADKAAYWDYLMWAEQNIRKDGLIILDNVILNGAVWAKSVEKTHFNDKQIAVMKKVNERIADSKLYKSCLIPTDEGLSVAQKLF